VDAEALVIIALAFGIPATAAAFRPTWESLVVPLVVGLGFVTFMVARDDWHPTQPDDLAWAAILWGVMSALVVAGWFVGRTARRRARRVGPA
jgi:hypothetical protein